MFYCDVSTIRFVVANYPTMDIDKMILTTGLSLSTIKRIAYKNNVFRERKFKELPVYNEGDTRVINGKKYVRKNGKWISYIRFVYEHSNPPLKEGQWITLIDKTKDITPDNIILYQKKYVEKATEKEVKFVKRICEISNMEYDDIFMSTKKDTVTKLKQVICVLHKDLFGGTEGISFRQARLGSAIGRDRTQVRYYEGRHEESYKFDPEYRRLYNKVKSEYDTKEV